MSRISAFFRRLAEMLSDYSGYGSPIVPRCEACLAVGIWREDHEAHLCDTHAEVPSYEPVTSYFFDFSGTCSDSGMDGRAFIDRVRPAVREF